MASSAIPDAERLTPARGQQDEHLDEILIGWMWPRDPVLDQPPYRA
jgi:hypothetical protein